MAQQLETDEGVVPEEKNEKHLDGETAKWLSTHKLEKLIPKFIEDDVTLDDLKLFELTDIDGFELFCLNNS